MSIFHLGFILSLPVHVCSTAPLLTVSSIVTEPYLIEDTDADGNKTYKGYTVDLLNLIKEKANFDYVLDIPRDASFGNELADGNWSGTINEVLQKRAAFAAGPITATVKRSKVVEFSIPFQQTGFAIVFKKPEDPEETLNHRLLRIWQPLSTSVWLLIFISYVVSSTILYIVSYFNPYEWRRMSHDGEATLREGESFTCMNSFWFAISSMMWQGHTRAPRSLGGRIVVIFWWFFVVVSIACYIANLSNLLKLSPHLESLSHIVKIKNLEDLVNSDIPFLILKDGSMQEFIERSDLAIAGRLQSKFTPGKNGYGYVKSIEEGLKKVNEEDSQKLAFVSETLLTTYYMHRYSCELYIVEDDTINRQYVFTFQKSSVHKQDIDTAILDLQESGKLRALSKFWFLSVGECKDIKFDESSSEIFKIPEFYELDLGHFSGALLVLAIGLTAGGIVTIIEYVIFRNVEEPEKRNTHLKEKQKPIKGQEGVRPEADVLLSEKKDSTV